MMANRFCATFAEPDSVGCEGSASLKGTTPGIMGWNKRLNGVADVYSLMNEIQRTWAYLESLFIHSDEVKKELPEATKRFEKIDINVKVCLGAATCRSGARRCANIYTISTYRHEVKSAQRGIGVNVSVLLS